MSRAPEPGSRAAEFPVGQRVRLERRWPAAVWFGTVCDAEIPRSRFHAGDRRVCLRFDGGLRVMYDPYDTYSAIRGDSPDVTMTPVHDDYEEAA